MEQTREPTTVGATLKYEFMPDRGMTTKQLAKQLGMHRPALRRMLENETHIDAKIAQKLSNIFDTEPQFWLNLQKAHRAYVKTLIK